MSRELPNPESVFAEIIEIESPEKRAAFLDQACCNDPEFRREMEKLVFDHFRAGQFLERPATHFVATAPQPSAERPGTLIGPYKLIEQIGEGGFGAVFMAEQREPVRRMVALKVIKPGMDSRQVVARFEAERQALAMMDHPNIAKVLGAGATDAGRPYFVMELVRGIPITDYCDQAGFSVRTRLQLFVQVCRAVQHAHTKGVIHRDLKPGNVLVTSDDGVPVPIVIDFGVSKALGQQLSELSVHTGFAQMIGTPLYMSPEQAEPNKAGVDTRSDIYSLGVLLYELLTGATPFDKDRLRTVDFDEMRRILREEEPPRPSTRLSTLGAALSTVSERRGVDPRKLAQTLLGELDWIVLKALEKDRNRRYETASAFAADVQRHLDDEPVEACPPAAVYRLRKFARRNKVALATTGLVAAALLIGTAFSVWQAIEATAAHELADKRLENEKRARNDAEIDRKKSEAAERKATTEAAIARAVNDFLQQDVLRQVDTDPQFRDESSGNTNLTVKEALVRAAAKIGARFQDQPLVEAAIRMVIGDAYQSVAESTLAVPHLERAVALRQAHLDPDHPNTLASMNRLAGIYSWAGRHTDAITLYQKVLDNRQARLGPDDPKTLQCVCLLATAYQMAGQCYMGVRLLEPVLEKQRIICGPTHPDTLQTMHELARCYGFQDRFAESMALHEELLGALKSMNGPLQKSPSWPMVTFACVCQRAGQFDKAEQLFRKVLEQDRKRKDDTVGKRNGIANSLGFLALNELLQHHYDAAETLVREAMAQKPTEMQRCCYWMSILGAALLGQHKYADAEPLLLQGYGGMKQRESWLQPSDKRRLSEAGEWVVRFYEVTNQPAKVRVWREKIAPKKEH
jgi:serine/threonine protein kinase/tetratricopeptide (TPR) repeat protein